MTSCHESSCVYAPSAKMYCFQTVLNETTTILSTQVNIREAELGSEEV